MHSDISLLNEIKGQEINLIGLMLFMPSEILKKGAFISHLILMGENYKY